MIPEATTTSLHDKSGEHGFDVAAPAPSAPFPPDVDASVSQRKHPTNRRRQRWQRAVRLTIIGALVSGAVAGVFSLIGCQVRPFIEYERDTPQTQPGAADDTRDWRLDPTANRGNERIRELLDGVAPDETAAGPDSGTAPPPDESGIGSRGRPLPDWRVEAMARQAHGLDSLVSAGVDAPDDLVYVYYVLKDDRVSMRGLFMRETGEHPEYGRISRYTTWLDHLINMQRAGLAEVGHVSEALREPLRRVLIELGKRRAEVQ